MRRRTATAVVVAMAALGASAPAQARPTLHDGVDGFKIRPPTILVSGDGSGWLGGAGYGAPPDYGRIRWTAFTRSGARGKGRLFASDCLPDCAGGTWSK